MTVERRQTLDRRQCNEPEEAAGPALFNYRGRLYCHLVSLVSAKIPIISLLSVDSSYISFVTWIDG